ncbi:malate dehydrogenase (quinone) [Staphylococcus auricularis]|uniref:Probable malate:quinone oxidoreductase n=1 Tax=Staphylococcus auricularis TaxID=29379 RepID=A0AAP8PQ95_9STAP|nr:malate dehydrogenase (quinone) [Staphylococcus auricularis]MBM0867124.1 malate dehydrogenase (quinone) [Staphylococcus auricularis]MCG7340819.1 malate dehydrogenase (quinone) [Staphylococcus auricularis]MDC6327318.1 malate dehydrogenase (quinone) [Staphylococcus auricularis]MDN4532968.1 malate dehydrogenase (quinone) [Staphylococcus auricularis]PNZ68600.1 malate dehydrogenase (quinone) [Staphylococcus auricularis]
MSNTQSKDVILIGAGVLSTTFGTLLKHLAPDWNITLYERLDRPAIESSNESNNAGTGHAALCELNYTVEQKDGSIDIEKAKEINQEFEISKQFWSYLVQNKEIEDPQAFIRPLPHISFVMGRRDVSFLKRRFETLSQHPMFEGMEYTEDKEKLAQWMPLMMQGRDSNVPVAASKIDYGTDVNFGELTRQMAKNLSESDHATVHYRHEVVGFNQRKDRKWEVRVKDLRDNTVETHITDYIFIGAGGHAIPLLQKTGIPESKHLGGFPISGAFLVCRKPEVVEQHDAKVYGKEPPGTPPMTVPHLDKRYINGGISLLFGPFAAIGPKFLKNGSNLDLFKSLNSSNLLTMASAGLKNFPLVKYSIQQVLMKKEDRMKELRRFVPDARDEDWELHIAGKRVQVIKDTKDHGRGFIQFGTEVVNSQDHSVIALLGESPGASTSVSVALEVLERNFAQYGWSDKIKEIIPSYGESLITDTKLMHKIRKQTNKTLQLDK